MKIRPAVSEKTCLRYAIPLHVSSFKSNKKATLH